MTSAEYWRERALAVQESTLAIGDDYAKRLADNYRTVMEQTEKEIRAFYQKFATNNGLSYADAMQVLTTAERAKYQMTLERYTALASQWGTITDPKLRRDIENASITARLTRLDTLMLNTKAALGNLANAQEHGLRKTVSKVYAEDYYRTIYEIQKASGTYRAFATVSPEKLTEMARTPWAADGRNFSQRRWGNTAALAEYIRTDLAQVLIRGDSVADVVKQVAKRFGTGYAVAKRLVETESAYYSAQATFDGYKSQGVEFFEFIATLDETTCKTCGGLDGEVFKLEDFASGVNAESMHAHCRCTTAPALDPEEQAAWDEADRQTRAEMATNGEKVPEDWRIARDASGNSYKVDSSLTYAQWKEKYAPEPPQAKDVPVTGTINLSSPDFVNMIMLESLGGEYTSERISSKPVIDLTTGGDDGILKSMEENSRGLAMGDTLDTTVKGDVSISEEDLRYLRDAAKIQYINKFTTLRPKLSATFGDVNNTSPEGVLEFLVESVAAASASALR
jgi:SPP1 gp7 family putative phage head morphogenesis protein